MRYDPKKIQEKWQKRWLEEKVYEPDLKRAKRPFFNLMMFPYPSAEGLHIGAVRTFSGVDIYGRFKRMQRHDVFEPIGLDGFGIHSENYALKIGKHPARHAKDSEKNFYRQLGNIGNGFAWRERLETYDPNYYKWTQWIFVQMFKRGLAYRKKASVNWCPSCMTVLADEQVIQKSQIPNPKSQTNPKSQIQSSKHEIRTGVCERCDTPVIQKDLEQWFFKITDYAERLLKNLNSIDWPESIKIAQRNWIGRSEGALIRFPVMRKMIGSPTSYHGSRTSSYIDVFTTRPDTLFGATYIVFAPEHKLVVSNQLLVTNWKEVDEYVKKAKMKADGERVVEGREKTGVELKGVKAVNPATKEEIPIWVADYVLGHVGTGAIMAVPAHDERDFEFAKKFGLPVKNVVEPIYGSPQEDEVRRKAVISIVRNPRTNEVIVLNWGPRKERHGGNMLIGGTVHDGEDLETAARREIAEETGYTDLKLIKKSDVVGHGHFYSNTKYQNVYVDAYGMYFELESDSRRPVKLDHGEGDKFLVEWHHVEKVASMLHDGIHAYFYRTLVLGECYEGVGILSNSGEFNGMDSEKAKWEITKFVGGEKKVQYRLRDWLVSRQRYWGPPIPLIFCENCKKLAVNPKSKIQNPKSSKGELENPGWIAVPEKDLPVKLPNIKSFRPTGTEKAPLATVEKFWKVKCPKCKSWARRETDVSDSFLDSSWYFIGYLMAFGNWKLGFGNSAFAELTRRWLPVDMYIGGAEHAVLHLLYSRFVTMAFYDWGLVPFEEPYKVFRTHGLITKDGFKMSKSRGNIVNPDEYINAYGVDAIRMYLAFMAPLTQGGDFRDTGIKGLTRFLERVWKFGQKPKTKNQKPKSQIKNKKLQQTLHKTIKKVTGDIEALQYNTAISALMILLNEFESNEKDVSENDWDIFLKLLAPFAPFIAEELWRDVLKEKTSIHLSPWPQYDSKLIQEDTFELVIQVNDKVRGRISLPVGITEADAKKAALATESVKKHIRGEPRKVIFVPNKLINLVV